MASYGEAFASALNAGSATIYRGIAGGKLADERRANREIADVSEASRAAYLDKVKAIEADTSLSDHDRMQAINAARGERFDALQSVYEKHNRGEDFNKIISADVANRNNLTNQAVQDRRDIAAKRQEDAAYAEDQNAFKTLVQAARDGDKKAQAKFNLIAAVNGMQTSIDKDGMFMVSPLAGGEAVPLNMTQAFDAWRGFKPIEQQIQALYGNEALRTGDSLKLDSHNKSESSLKNDAVNRAHMIEDTRRLHNANKALETPDVIYTAHGTGEKDPYSDEISNAKGYDGKALPAGVVALSKDHPEQAEAIRAQFYKRSEAVLSQLAGTAQDSAPVDLDKNGNMVVGITDPASGKQSFIRAENLSAFMKDHPDLFVNKAPKGKAKPISDSARTRDNEEEQAIQNSTRNAGRNVGTTKVGGFRGIIPALGSAIMDNVEDRAKAYRK